ncbi:MAG: flagellar protein FlgN [Desulfitobacteriaceae bacterium]|nr:flagellar protein FlgN [Desulfitobacteriaceae bacterium]MDI6879469.1 flagellar protein FlgN [Desulfitobacteriaceae bacterium]MDI6912938.1 flagellar protein FlgN [Desulfitobacteriaceae bacterium]
MEETLSRLNENLDRQLQLYRTLNELAGLKQEALLRGSMQELEQITAREERLLLEAARLEKERLLWADEIGQEMGKAAEDLTLAELAERFPVLQGVRVELDQVIGDLQNAHELNSQLIGQALDVIDFTVSLVTRPDEATYAHPKRKEQNPPPTRMHLFDKMI